MTVRVKRRFLRRSGPLSCKQVVEVLQAYLDGELDDLDVPDVDAHLDACAHCGLEAAIYERIKAALAAPAAGPVDPDAIERLRRFAEDLPDR